MIAPRCAGCPYQRYPERGAAKLAKLRLAQTDAAPFPAPGTADTARSTGLHCNCNGHCKSNGNGNGNGEGHFKSNGEGHFKSNRNFRCADFKSNRNRNRNCNPEAA